MQTWSNQQQPTAKQMCLCAIGTAVKASLCTHQMNKWAAPLPVLAYALGIAAKYREDTERPLPSQAGPRNRCVTVWKRLLSKPTDEFTTAYEQASTSAMVLQLIDPSDGRNRMVTEMRHPASSAHRPTSLRVQHAVHSWSSHCIVYESSTCCSFPKMQMVWRKYGRG